MTLAVALGVALVLAILGRFDPAEAIAAPPGASVTRLPDDTWLVLGGGVSAPSEDGYVHDPMRQERAPLPGALRHARAGHTATLLADGRILVWGGVGRDGRLVTAAEVFDPAFRQSAEGNGPRPAPRARHTATLLPDGRVLLAGGVDAAGELTALVETWDVGRGLVIRWPDGLPAPRADHAATLTSGGHVRIAGGADAAGSSLTDAVDLDPDRQSARPAPAPVSPAGPPAVGRTWPPAGAAGVPVDLAVALAIEPPLDPASVTADTVVLIGPAGPIASRVVPAEGGRLLVVTPRAALVPGTRHTLVVDGASDDGAAALPRFALSFTTAGDEGALVARAAGRGHRDVAGPADHSSASAAADEAGGDGAWPWHGPRRDARPWSPWQDLVPRRAPPGMTALSGQVLDLAGEPLGGIVLAIGARRARTDDTGRFLLTLPQLGSAPAGPLAPRELVIDGGTDPDSTSTYGRFEVAVELTARETTVLPYTIWLPALDRSSVRAVPAGPLASDLVLTSPRLPGLEVHLPAGTRLVDHDGRPITRVTLTPIPQDRPPFPLPPGADTPVYFTVQPGGAYIAHADGAGAKLVYPNFPDRRRAPLGTRWAFWHYEPDDGGWTVYGEGTVGQGGAQVFPDPGVVVYEFSGAMINVASLVPPSIGPLPGNQAWAGDPVDLGTGLFVFSTTDLFLPGPPALAVSRTYRPEDPAIRPFGRGANHDYGIFLWSAQQYQEADLVLPDGGRVHYVRTSPGTSFQGAVFAHTGSPTPFSGSTVRWVDPGGGWDLRLRDGTVLHFGENAPLQWIRDRNGQTVTLHRAGDSPTGRLARVSSSSGRWLAFEYDAAGCITEARDSAGRTVRYAYDGANRLVAVTDPAGGVTRYTYDVGHRMLALTDSRGITFLTNRYGADGRVVGQTLADGGATGFTYALDAAGRIVESRVEDAGGRIRRVTFDTAGYLRSDTHAWGTALARTLTVERDPASQRVSALGDALGRRTTFVYDAVGNLTSLTALAGTPSAVTWRIAYEPVFSRPTSITDPLGRVTALAYDGRGNATSITDPTGRALSVGYDAEGRPVTVTTAAGTASYGWQAGDLVAVTDTGGHTWSRGVDAAGRPTAVRDPLGRTTRFVWDALNRLVERVDAAGGRTSFRYDPAGNLLEATDALGHRTSFTVDAMDRQIARTDPLGAVSSREYDLLGRLVALIDRLGQATTVAWDDLDRPMALTDADGEVTTYTWDAGDRLVRVDDSRSGPISYAYDPLDRVVEEATSAGSVTHEYNGAGRPIRLVAPPQPAIVYAYDGAGRLTGVTQDTGTLALTHDGAGRPMRLQYPTGLVTDITWDAASRVSRIAWRRGMALVGDLTQAYDAAGQPVAQGGSWAATRLPAALGGASYDAANRPSAFGGRTLTWDAEGRLVAQDHPVVGRTSYTWNARGQLVGVDTPLDTLAFEYDGLGRRAEWLYDGLTPVQERRDGDIQASRLVGPGLDQLWARTGDAGRRWPLADIVGSPIAWVDDAGAVTTRAVYGPFGEAAMTGELQTVAFTGREQDLPDLLHFRARAYVPSLQRFISEDPIDEPGANPYVYVNNAPLSGVDPLGLLTIIIHGGPASMGPNGRFDQGGNRGLNDIAAFLSTANEPVKILNVGQYADAFAIARTACLAGQPVHLVGHSLGGFAALDIAWKLLAMGIQVSDLTLFDSFYPRQTTAPPGVPTLNFFQRQHLPRGEPLGGRKVNPLKSQLLHNLPGYAHSTITLHPSAQNAALKMILGHEVPCMIASP